MKTRIDPGRYFSLAALVCYAIAFVTLLLLPVARGADENVATAKPIRVVVWDEQQPSQKEAYDNFLGNAIAEDLKSKPGFEVKSVKLDDPEQGLSDEVLDHCDVLLWWGHGRHGDVTDENAKRVLDRIKAGKLSLIVLHSAHYSKPFMLAMNDRSIEDAINALPEADRKNVEVKTEVPKPGLTPPDAPLTPSSTLETAADGKKILHVKLPACVFPAVRADGKPSHVTTVSPDHPIAAGVPKTFDIPQTEMYAEPFHVPTPDAVIFEEKWDAGEHFRTGCLWQVGKGQVFYFRPGHETWPIFKQAEVKTIMENATRWLGTELQKADAKP